MFHPTNRAPSTKIKIDGIIYSSLSEASLKRNISRSSLTRHWLEFCKTPFREREVNVHIPTIIKLQKLTEEEEND